MLSKKNSVLCKFIVKWAIIIFIRSLRCQDHGDGQKTLLNILYFLSALISPENPLNRNQFTDQRVKF